MKLKISMNYYRISNTTIHLDLVDTISMEIAKNLALIGFSLCIGCIQPALHYISNDPLHQLQVLNPNCKFTICKNCEAQAVITVQNISVNKPTIFYKMYQNLYLATMMNNNDFIEFLKKNESNSIIKNALELMGNSSIEYKDILSDIMFGSMVAKSITDYIIHHNIINVIAFDGTANVILYEFQHNQFEIESI